MGVRVPSSAPNNKSTLLGSSVFFIDTYDAIVIHCGGTSMKQIIDNYWNQFLRDTKLPSNTTYIESFAFGINEEIANSLLELVLSGTKTATCSSKIEYEITNTKIPQIGDYSIVTNWAGTPKCIIKTVAVTYMKFKEMTYNICKREGEDENLDSWINGHVEHFTAIADKLMFEFNHDLEILFEDFIVVYK